MTTHNIRIIGPTQRSHALQCVQNAPEGYVVSIRPENRTAAQNRLLWPCLAEIARHDPLEMKYADWEYKLVMMDALHRFQCDSAGMETGQRLRMMQGTDGNYFPSTEGRSSQLSKAEFSDLIMIIKAYADRHGIVLPEREPDWRE